MSFDGDGPVIFLVYEVRPDETNPLRDSVGGAFVSCWIDTDSEQEAEQRAVESIESAGWTIETLDMQGVVDTSKYLYSRTAVSLKPKSTEKCLCSISTIGRRKPEPNCMRAHANSN